MNKEQLKEQRGKMLESQLADLAEVRKEAVEHKGSNVLASAQALQIIVELEQTVAVRLSKHEETVRGGTF